MRESRSNETSIRGKRLHGNPGMHRQRIWDLGRVIDAIRDSCVEAVCQMATSRVQSKMA